MDRPDRPRIISAAAKLAAGAYAHPYVATFIAAILPRLAFVFELRAGSPTFDAPEGGDSILYDRLASGAHEASRAYFHSPLYIAFLRAFYRTVGREFLALRLLQHVLGALACVLVAHVALKAFHSRSTALLAGFLAAMLGPVLFYEGQLGVDALMPPLVLGCVALAFFAWSRRTTLSYGLLGTAIGITALGRAVVLAWIPILFGWAVAARPRRWEHGGALLLGTLLAILPVTVRNWRVEGTFVPITANGGLNFYIGNNDGANGGYVLPQGVAFRPGDPSDDFEGEHAAEQDVGRRLNSAEVSAWWSRRAWDFIGSEPERVVWLVLEKAQLLTSNVEYTQLHDYNVYGEVAPILRVLPTAGFVVVPGLAGLIALYFGHERRPLARRLGVLALVFAAGFLPFFVVGRYRGPWLALLAPFAAWWVQRMIAFWRARDWNALLVPGVIATTLTCVSAYPIPVPSTGLQYMQFALASLGHDDTHGAAHWCERALERDPMRVDAAALLGRLLRREGHYQAAENVLSATVLREPHAAEAWLELGRVDVETGDEEAGIDALLSSVDADPRSLDAWSALAQALRSAGRNDEASDAEQSLQRLVGKLTR
jgi:hypothetical protein